MPQSKKNKNQAEPKTQAKTESKLTLSEKIDQLDRSVEWFYSEDFALSEAIDRYERASTLAKDIEEDLKKLKNRIEVIEKDFSS